jgi:hypothetical protein
MYLKCLQNTRALRNILTFELLDLLCKCLSNDNGGLKEFRNYFRLVFVTVLDLEFDLDRYLI